MVPQGHVRDTSSRFAVAAVIWRWIEMIVSGTTARVDGS
jgi:hypothetical protein